MKGVRWLNLMCCSGKRKWHDSGTFRITTPHFSANIDPGLMGHSLNSRTDYTLPRGSGSPNEGHHGLLTQAADRVGSAILMRESRLHKMRPLGRTERR